MSNTKTTRYLWVAKRKNAEPEKMPLKEFASYAAGKCKTEPSDIRTLILLALNGEEPEIDPDLPARQRNAAEKSWKFVMDTMDTHRGHLDKLEDLKAEAEALKEKAKDQAKEMVLSAEIIAAEGDEIVKASPPDWSLSAEKALPKFEVTGTSLKPKKGAKLDAKEALGAVAWAMAESEKADRSQTSHRWHTGDAIMLAEEFNGGREAIEQMVEITGKQKHTVRDSLRIARIFPPEERIEEFTYTHHQEIANYQGKIKDARKLKALIAKARKGDVTKNIELANGETYEKRVPWSVKRLRDGLRELAGLPSRSEKDEAKAKGESVEFTANKNDEEDTFLYVDAEGEVFYGSGFNEDAAVESSVIINLSTLSLVGPAGDELGKVYQLDGSKGHWPGAPTEEAEEEEEEEDAIPV